MLYPRLDTKMFGECNTGYSDLAIQKAKSIKVVFSDVDGVFTNNQVLEGAPYKAKWRSYYDGQGVSMLRAIGIRVVLITNEKGDSAKHIEDVVRKWNSLPSSIKEKGSGGWEHVILFTGRCGYQKIEAAKTFLEAKELTFSCSAFMGDDLVDVALLELVALRAAPESADPAIKDIAHFVSKRPGGMGAFRDFANFLLCVRGINPFDLPPQ